MHLLLDVRPPVSPEARICLHTQTTVLYRLFPEKSIIFYTFFFQIKQKIGTPYGESLFLLAAAAVVIAAATIVLIGAAAKAVVAATAEQDQQDDDPPNITTAEVIVAHNGNLQNIYLAAEPLIPRYSALENWCKKTGSHSCR